MYGILLMHSRIKINPSSSMRIDHDKLDYLSGLCKKHQSYNNLMERIIDAIEAHPTFKQEVCG